MENASALWTESSLKFLVPKFAVDSPPLKADDVGFLRHAFSTDNDGVVMTTLTVILTIILELASLDAVRKICRSKAGAQLYAEGVLMNIVNNCILGPMAYQFVNIHFMSAPFANWLARARMVGAILGAHAIGYYLSHRWMHTRRMYWAHKFREPLDPGIPRPRPLGCALSLGRLGPVCRPFPSPRPLLLLSSSTSSRARFSHR